MFKKIGLTYLLLCCVSLVFAQDNSRWTFVGENAEEDVWFIDASSIAPLEQEGPHIKRFVALLNFNPEQENRTAGSAVAIFSANCEMKALVLETISLFSARDGMGDFLGASAPSELIGSSDQDVLDQRLIAFVCGKP